MNKNTIIAFILMFLLILVWSYFGKFGSPPKPAIEKTAQKAETEKKEAQPEPEKVSLKTDRASDSLKTEAKEVNQEPAIRINQEYIEIKTSLWQAVLNNEGGKIEKFSLAKFKVARQDKQVEQSGDIAIVWKKGAKNDLRTMYEVTKEGDIQGGEAKIIFTDKTNNITKIYTLYKDKYSFDLEIKVQNDFEYEVLWRGAIDFFEFEHDQEIQNSTLVSFYPGGNFDRFSLSDYNKKYKEEFSQVRFLALRSKFFLAVMQIENTQSLPGSFSVRRENLEPINEKEREKLVKASFLPFTMGFNVKGEGKFKLFLGPADYNLLKTEYGDWYNVIDFGWPVIRSISPLLLKLFHLIYAVIPQYGWVIVIFSLIMKFAFWPLTHKSMKSMNQMKEVQPKIEALKERYKSDPKKLQEETFKIYKDFGVNPISGCLPLLIQMPIFFALYRVLSTSIELRQAKFLWVTDLSSPDVLFTFKGSLPFIGSEMHLLPLLMGAIMFWQQKMTITDPKQKMMVYFMPIFMTFIFYSIPSGLVLYWFVNSILSLVEQYIIEYKKKAKQATS